MNFKLLSILPLLSVAGLSFGAYAIATTPVFHNREIPPKEATIISEDGERYETDINMLIVAFKPETTVVEYIFSSVGPAQEILTSAGVNAYSGAAGDEEQEKARENAWVAASLMAGKRTSVVVTDAPEEYALQPGDIIVNKGSRVTFPSKLNRNFYPRAEPTTTFKVIRDGKKIKVTVPSNNFLMIANGEIKFEVFASKPNSTSVPELTNVQGGSSGLPLFIAYYEYLTGEDITRDDTQIAATGTIQPDIYGEYAIGPIGSLNVKIEEAVEAGMDTVLVPAIQHIDAERLAAGRIKVIPVSSASDVIEKLREDYLSGFCENR